MKLKEIVAKVILGLSSIYVLVPIIAGIIVQMIWMIPLAYTSWALFLSFGVRWAEMGSGFTFDGNHLPLGILVFIIEIAVFIVGVILLIWGFIQIVRARKKGIHLIQTGPYKYIRHPQHLGIILISLSFYCLQRSIYILHRYSVINVYYRFGDILSWMLFSLILIIWSDIEERKMQNKYPDEFADYATRTGFFFPKIGNKQTLKIQKEKRYYYYLIRYLIFLIIYCVTVLSMFLYWKYVQGGTLPR